MSKKPTKNEIINVPEQIIDNKFKQSANTLFNFMEELDYLKEILRNMAIIPRYVEETMDYIIGNEVHKVVFPMTCFCDIGIQKLVPHMEFYGFYGIGFDKDWGIKKGIQPINYLNLQSDLLIDLNKAFKYAYYGNEKESNEAEEILVSFLLKTILYSKPVNGKMLRKGKVEIKNFHDEKEWRYIPKEADLIDLPFFIPEEHHNSAAYNNYSAALKLIPSIYLNFEPRNVKYLIVNNDDSKSELIRFIMSEEVSIPISEKYDLLTKVLVHDSLKEDL